MKLIICAVKDAALDAFMRPMFVAAKGQAVRAFTDEVNKADSELNKHPTDYSLYYLGTYDDGDASFVSEGRPTLLIRAIDCLQSSN
ncbi:MAG: nonstructural protein [Microvirus sp.]|nr:MAG: nonstructural protein [Microvirus sp.]